MSPLQQLSHPLCTKYKVNVFIKRDDLLHPIVSGNKFRKLKYVIDHYHSNSTYHGIISFGGKYSNHIHALAYTCQQEKIPCTLFIRSYKNDDTLTPTLLDAQKWGSQIIFVPPSLYQYRNQPKDWLQHFPSFASALFVPEGGSHALALEGMKEVMPEVRQQQSEFTHLICPVGTGATLAGLAENKLPTEKLWGISALKGDKINENLQAQWGWDPTSIKVLNQWHFGGYGQCPPQLQKFITSFTQTTDIPLDPIYNGKSMYALFQLIRAQVIPAGAKVLFLHTGGLQGWRGTFSS